MTSPGKELVMENEFGRAPSGQALVQAPSPSVSAASGFDPSRESWKFCICDDGMPMVATAGDVVCMPDANHEQPDEWDYKNLRFIAAAPTLYRELQAAGAIFRAYEALHLEKGTDDGNAKARRNAAFAETIERTLANAIAIEAASAGETTKIGSTEGESAGLEETSPKGHQP